MYQSIVLQIAIFHTDLRVFFMSQTSERLHKSTVQVKTSVYNIIFYMDVREKKRFESRVFPHH